MRPCRSRTDRIAARSRFAARSWFVAGAAYLQLAARLWMDRGGVAPDNLTGRGTLDREGWGTYGLTEGANLQFVNK